MLLTNFSFISLISFYLSFIIVTFIGSSSRGVISGDSAMYRTETSARLRGNVRTSSNQRKRTKGSLCLLPAIVREPLFFLLSCVSRQIPLSAQSPTHQGACFSADGETISRHTVKRDG